MNHQSVLALQPHDNASLHDFLWGNDVLLQQQLQRLLHHQGERFLYLWGNEGSGKSYLLQACCQAISTRPTIYLPLKLLNPFGPHVIEGIEKQALICIDDIDVIAKNALWEEALFYLYNRNCDDEQTSLIITGRKPPTHLAIHLLDLRSRLNSGLVMYLPELNDENKILLLKNHAKKRGFELSSQVGHFLLNRCERNMHELHQLLHKLDEASLSAQRKVTIPFVKTILDL